MLVPHSFTSPMKPEQYDALYKRINPSHPTTLDTGTETTSDVTLNWVYDRAKDVLNITVTAVHSLRARLLPADKIQDDLAELLNS